MNFLTNREFIKDESTCNTSHYSTLTSTRRKIYRNADGTNENFSTVKWYIDEKPSYILDFLRCIVYCAAAEEPFHVVEKIEVCLEKGISRERANASCFRVDDVLTQFNKLSNIVPSWRFSLKNYHWNDRVAPLETYLKINTLILCANIKFATWRFLMTSYMQQSAYFSNINEIYAINNIFLRYFLQLT